MIWRIAGPVEIDRLEPSLHARACEDEQRVARLHRIVVHQNAAGEREERGSRDDEQQDKDDGRAANACTPSRRTIRHERGSKGGRGAGGPGRCEP